MQFGLLIFSVLADYCTTVNAADIAISMAKEKWESDQRIEFSLVLMIANQGISPDTLPNRLTCLLENDGRSFTVITDRVGEPGIPDSGNLEEDGKALYAFDSPSGISGKVSLRLPVSGKLQSRMMADCTHDR